VNERTRSIIVVLVMAGLVAAAYFGFFKPWLNQQRAVKQVRDARSTWTVTMQQYLHAGPLSEQTYRISNDDGKVAMFYSATNRDGTITKQFDVPLSGPQATFLYEQLRAEDIWGAPEKPIRPHPHDEYVVYIAQTLGDEGGYRVFGFSDPLFWATTKGREYPLNLKNPNTPVGVTSTPLQDKRYLNIVESVEAFGPPSVQQAQAKIRAELATSDGNPVHASNAGR
jgi:hypothetical protein